MDKKERVAAVLCVYDPGCETVLGRNGVVVQGYQGYYVLWEKLLEKGLEFEKGS